MSTKSITADKLLGISEEEFELREALENILDLPAYGSDVTDLEREIIVTPFDGAYGRAGLVLTINGSPPRALILVTTNLQENYVFVFRRPYRMGPIIEIKPPIPGWDKGRSKKKMRVYHAVFKYLKAQGHYGIEPDAGASVEADT